MSNAATNFTITELSALEILDSRGSSVPIKLKLGAPARGERVAKYNRLLEIAAHSTMPYGLG